MLRISDISSGFSACIQSIGANVGKLGSSAVSFFQSQSPVATGAVLALNGALVALIKKTMTLAESRFKPDYSDQVKHRAYGVSAATVTYALNAGLSKAGYQMQLVTQLTLSALSGLYIYRTVSNEAAQKARGLSGSSSTPKAKVDGEGDVKQSPPSPSSSRESSTAGKGLGTKIENLNPTDPAPSDGKKQEATKSSWWPSFF